MSVKIKATLTNDETHNGLDSIQNEITAGFKKGKPQTIIAVIALQAGEVLVKDTGEEIPRMNILSIEPVLPKDEDVARGIMSRATASRTGATLEIPEGDE